AQVTLSSATELRTTTIEVQETETDPKKPMVIKTKKEVVEEQIDHPIPQSSESSLKTAALDLLKSAYRLKHSIYLPRFDSIKSDGKPSTYPVDTLLQQSYHLEAKDPDDVTSVQVLNFNLPPAYVAIDLVVESGNVFAFGGIGGLISVLFHRILPVSKLVCSNAEALYGHLG
ncbi:MAG: hypothetical protein JNJ61_18700, partial [Anaerolineae bacterium]|nr:hypothetical protein [Anaerolineae bacterium]